MNLTDNKTFNHLKGTDFVDDFAKEIYEQTYRYGLEDINSTFYRIAKDLASVEKDPEYWTNKFQYLLEDFKFVPGGRIISNAGTGLSGTTYINCFTPETKVLTNNGYKNISDIEIGDMVLTHKGRFKPVVSLMKKEHSGKMVTFESPFLTDKIQATPEHPFYSGNNEQTNAENINELFFLKYEDNNKSNQTIDVYEYVKNVTRKNGSKSFYADDEYVYATYELFHRNEDDKISIITTKKDRLKRYVDLDEDFSQFIGNFIKSGKIYSDDINSVYNINTFKININYLSEKDLNENIVKNTQMLNKVFGIEKYTKEEEVEHLCQLKLQCKNVVLSNFLYNLCGINSKEYSLNKEYYRIPNVLWNTFIKNKINFCEGFFNNYQTSNKSMESFAYMSTDLLFLSELQAFTHMCKAPSKMLYCNNAFNKLRWCFTQNIENINVNNNEYDQEILSTKTFNKNEVDYEGYVYNISVMDDESYVVNNVIVHNCFVDGFVGEDQDSMSGIFDALRRQGLILKSEGGYGFCADVMRPRGAFIQGIGNESPGAVRMLDMWDTQSAVITEGSGKKSKKEKSKQKIRKGAQMVTMSCWHPDIVEFITAKQTSGRLTKFNMSVLITDDFMEAVDNNQPWNLEFPDYEANITNYKKYQNGNLKEWKSNGHPTTIFKTYENANELWDLIMESTYNRNEPGVLYVDTMNRLNNLYYCEFINATNPCGEQVLPIGAVCLLGSINLTQFIDYTNKTWDFEKLKEIVPIAVRLMDNVNDVTKVPLEIQQQNLKDKRRIGLGIMGYGSALMMLKLKYGSPEALKITEDLMQFIANTAYQASSDIAMEKGSFTLFDMDKYLAGNFVKNLSTETIEKIRKQGLRNSHLLSIQPTGNSSIFANIVSGGLEPIFMPEYKRTSIMPYPPNGLDIPHNIDWVNKTYTSETKQEWIKEGDENLLKTKHDDYNWKYDKSRGLLRETIVKDYAVRYLENKGEWDSAAEWAATTTELSIDEHILTMSVMAKYIDSAMSKTVNIPTDYPYNDFKRLYKELYNSGVIKGGTSYRAGTMTEVLGSINSEFVSVVNKIQKTNAPKRPEVLDCDIHHISTKGEKWIVLVGMYDEDPYEVFAFKSSFIQLSDKIKSGKTRRAKKGHYNLECNELIIENIAQNFETDEQEALTRMISTALRHGANIEFVVDQLLKSQGTITSFSKAIGRTLKKYIKEQVLKKTCDSCGSHNVSLQEGCYVCLDCGSSKCS